MSCSARPTAMPPTCCRRSWRYFKTFPRIQVELRCALSTPPVNRVQKGEVDIALVTRMNGFTGGQVVHQEQLVWIVGEDSQAHLEEPVRLALLPPGNIYREHAIEHIERAGHKWQIACVSESMGGLQAAVFAGMAVTVLCRSALVPGMRTCTERRFSDAAKGRPSALQGAGSSFAGSRRVARISRPLYRVVRGPRREERRTPPSCGTRPPCRPTFRRNASFAAPFQNRRSISRFLAPRRNSSRRQMGATPGSTGAPVRTPRRWKEFVLREPRRDNLQSDREAVAIASAGHRRRRQTRQVDRPAKRRPAQMRSIFRPSISSTPGFPPQRQ